MRPTVLYRELRFRGTFFPLRRASDRPIAIACLRLFTLPPRPPLPLLSVPRLRRCIARLTSLEAEREYLRAMSYLNAALALMKKTNEIGTLFRIAAPLCRKRRSSRHARESGHPVTTDLTANLIMR